MKKFVAAASSAVLLAMSACDKASEASSNSGDQPANPPTRLLAEAVPQAREKSLPKPDRETPDASYVKVESGNQLMFLYYALSGLRPDYEAIAQAYSEDYRRTSDAFKKQDILSVIKPRIDAELSAAKSQRYFTYEIGQPGLDHYDFQSKSFLLKHVSDDYTWYLNDNGNYKLIFANGDSYQKLPVLDEEAARKIEGFVNKYPYPSLVVYGFAQDVDLNKKLVKAQIVKVLLLDPSGNPIARN